MHFVGYLYVTGHSGHYFPLKWFNKTQTQTGYSSETLTVSDVDVDVLFDKWISSTANMTIDGKVHPRI